MSGIPKIELRKNDKIWMDLIYKNYFENKRINYRELRSTLYTQLPANFDSSSMDKRLMTHNSELPSLLGIIAVEGNESIVEDCNAVILAIRDILLNEPNREEFSSVEIAERCGLDKTRVELMIPLFSNYGHFYRSASMRGGGVGYDSLSIGGDDKIYDYYLKFENFRKVLEDYFEEEAERNKIFEKKSSAENIFDFNPLPAKRQVSPNRYFTSDVTAINRNLCFVIMPFKESWSDAVYFECIRPNIEAMGLQCLRADNLNGEIIMEDVWIQLNTAAFVLADVTNRNSNVMYELGIAHALNKPVILITQNIDNIPFDMLHHRHHQYSNALGGNKFFENEFREVVKGVYLRDYPESKDNLKF